jgi:AsmA-like C-terminal region
MPKPPQQGSATHARKLIILSAVVLILIGAIIFAFSRAWPFAENQVLQNLREASDSQVEVKSFHLTYFPSPGCTLEGVVFRHSPGQPTPLISIDKLIVEGSYHGLISEHLRRITAVGMVVAIPPFGAGKPFHTTQSKITTDEVIANGAKLEFISDTPGSQPLLFDVHEASFRDVSWSGPLTYRLKVHNPEPPGEVSAEGKFGVWNESNPGETPVSGQYKFDHADLGVYQGIAGTLASTGKFEGKVAHIDITGTTDVPDFLVTSGKHPARLTTEFSAYVDAIHGDTFLNRVSASFSKTRILAQGSVAGSANGNGKIALIDLKSNQARIEDFLRLFVSANRSPMSGSVTLQFKAELPPGPEDFLKRVKLRGAFGVAGGTFSNSSTQQGIDKLSAGARGENEKEKENPETVLTNLKAQVSLVGGTAHFTDLSFGIPGAAANMLGTYNLINYKIDLRGQMRVDSKISNTTDGSKAFFLKMMQPFFKKKRKGEIVPVKISGTYQHPTFGLDLEDKRTKNMPAP